MKPETLFDRLAKDLKPASGAKKRIQERIRAQLDTPAILSEAHKSLTPSSTLQSRIWARVRESLPVIEPVMLFDRIREFLTPGVALRQQIFGHILPHLQAVPVVSSSYGRVKWVSAFVIVALLMKTGPQLFLAPHTIADSAVMLLPMQGEVYVLMEDLWQQVGDDYKLEAGTLIRTGEDSAATIVYHDDGVLRMSANTTVEIQDVSHRLEPAPDLMPTFSLRRGEVWAQGLVPANVRGLTVATSYGHVTLNEGSASIEEGSTVTVSVWDRRATVTHEGHDAFLIAGERTEMWDGNVLLVKKISDNEYTESYVKDNLSRDAVHRSDIAQQQHERRIALAGILPTSSFYPVKRVAEKVDVLLTFGEEARLEKQLAQAETRLNEAAALLAEGEDEGAQMYLAEYQKAIQEVAAGDESLAQFLLRRSIVETTAEVAAVLPGDDAYVIKKAVLVATAGLSDGFVNPHDAQGELFVDALSSLNVATIEADAVAVQDAWTELGPYLALIQDEEVVLSPQLHKEVMALLERAAEAIIDRKDIEVVLDGAFIAEVASYLPPEPAADFAVLSEEEILSMAMAIRERIFLYDMKQSRVNQFIAEMRALAGNPYEGPVLRRLARVLPDGPENFKRRVQSALTDLRWEQAAVL